MNRPLSTVEFESFITSVPSTSQMTRREKLLRFAEVIRKSRTGMFAGRRFRMFSNLEYISDDVYEYMNHPDSPFAAAYKDKLLREAGLESHTVGAAKRFFELSRDDLHAFSCDCGGVLSNETMARRIEAIADSSFT